MVKVLENYMNWSKVIPTSYADEPVASAIGDRVLGLASYIGMCRVDIPVACAKSAGAVSACVSSLSASLSSSSSSSSLSFELSKPATLYLDT